MTSENTTEAVKAHLAGAAGRVEEAIRAALENLDRAADQLSDMPDDNRATLATILDTSRVWAQIAVAEAVRELTAHIAAIGASLAEVTRQQAVARRAERHEQAEADTADEPDWKSEPGQCQYARLDGGREPNQCLRRADHTDRGVDHLFADGRTSSAGSRADAERVEAAPRGRGFADVYEEGAKQQ